MSLLECRNIDIAKHSNRLSSCVIMESRYPDADSRLFIAKKAIESLGSISEKHSGYQS